MYYLIDFCCICLNNKNPLQHLFTADTDNITYFIKLTSCLHEMCFNEMNDRWLICKKCCENIEIVYKFRQKCQKSKTRLQDYFSQLPKVSNITDEVNVYLTDLINFDIVKTEFHKDNKTNTELFKDVDKITDQKEHSEIKNESSAISPKLTDPTPNYIKFETVVIKMESEIQHSEQHIDKTNYDPLGNRDEINIDISHNDTLLAASEIKIENQNQAVEEYLQESSDNILESCDSENIDGERKLEENCKYSISLDNCYEDFLINTDEIKIDIVHNDIELMNRKINKQCKSEDIEEFSNKDAAKPLKDQNVYNSDKDQIVWHKTIEDKSEIIVPSTSKVQDLGSRKEETIGNQIYECSLCQKKYSCASSLTTHMRIHAGGKIHECTICMKIFTCADVLTNHMEIHTGERRYECNICKKKFKRSNCLSRHMLVHTKEIPSECKICKKKFRHSNSLSRHMLVHTGKKTYKYECSICKKKFIQPIHLSTHMLIHTGELPFKCNICEKKFRQSGDLSRHMLVHTEGYECNICKKKFRHTKTLSSHMLVHTGELPYQCNICKKKFIQSIYLSRHMLNHTGEMPYKCNICEKKFRQSSDVSRHMLVHTGEKPYECNICTKKFRQSNHLSSHMSIHTGEKTYECNICKKKFICSSNLTKHMVVHTGEMPYECKICKNKFRHSKSLSRHMLVHSEKKAI